jgi:hypothetical protein
MTDYTEKAVAVLKATNGGDDLPEHHRHVVHAALRGELGRATKIVFDDLCLRVLGTEVESLNREE